MKQIRGFAQLVLLIALIIIAILVYRQLRPRPEAGVATNQLAPAQTLEDFKKQADQINETLKEREKLPDLEGK